MTDKIDILRLVSEALLNGKISDAKETALDYPFEKIEMQKKNYMGEFQSTQLFLRDGRRLWGVHPPPLYWFGT